MTEWLSKLQPPSEGHQQRAQQTSTQSPPPSESVQSDKDDLQKPAGSSLEDVKMEDSSLVVMNSIDSVAKSQVNGVTQ